MTGWRSLILGLALGAVAFLLLVAFLYVPARQRSEDKAEDCATAVVAGDRLAAEDVCP